MSCARLAMLATLLGVAACVGPRSQLAHLPDDWPPRIELSATPFHPQIEHQCGPAALATVLGAAGHSVPPSQLAAEVYLPGRAGSLQPELVAAARARGLLVYETGPTLPDVLAEVAAGRPVLVLQRLGAGPWPNWHYAVVVGYDQARQRVVLRSGVTEKLEQRATIFESTWNRGGHWAVVLIEPGRLPARPDLPRYMRAAADLEPVSLPAAKAAYRAAAEHWPEASLPRLGLGNVAAAQGDWSEAERWYREALAADPAGAAALNNRVESLTRLGCTAAAQRVLGEGMSRIVHDDPLRPALEQTALELSGPQSTRSPAGPGACPE